MGDENLLWSERARLGNSSGLSPKYVPPKPPPRKSSKTYVFVGIGVLVVAVIAVAVVILMPGGESTASTPGSSVTTASTLVTRTTSSTIESGKSLHPPTILYEEAISGFSFEYPAYWVEFSPERLVGASSPLPGALGVGDPSGARFGTTPANCVAFVPHVATEEELKEGEGEPDLSLSAELDIVSAKWASVAAEESPLQLVEPTKSLSINGIEAAEKTYRFLAQGHWMRWRLVFTESSPYWCILLMYTEEEHADKYWPIFDQMIDSLKLATTE